MDLLTFGVVGLIAGLLAAVVMRGSGLGILGDILLGIAGAVIGSWVFRELDWKAPFSGLAGVVAVAFTGSVIVLVMLRLFRWQTGSRPRD
jgi:uncharacterized membrane protein YeaQ/YmgE (transglycosylase-associated protein family)